ncbi:Uncharacterized protein HSBGL_4089 (plasmid) [Halapricum desulfuricans]|uniref:DUF8121 domain-containing protein n=1 Tax=Halapricum desulfuricans TaxID=2841257 RepID=A0A897NRP6_9EURY|nr:hypothetical protein [Halapricum desulfuricans]QSG13503.1 Uncharacterized protein HSBGL_4089 [Halapricum desulfuricans]
MNRRTYLTSVCAVGIAATAGCNTISGSKTLSEPTVNTESSGRKALIFTENDEEVGHLGVDGSVTSERIDLSTEIWHQGGTNVESIKLRVWMPETATESPAEIAIVSPVEGDSSPPPSVALYTPDQALGTSIEITDLDDLADETISTLNLIVIPGSETATRLNIHTTIELSDGGALSSDYTLDGELQLAYPQLTDK